jgi:hypothetical protein
MKRNAVVKDVGANMATTVSSLIGILHIEWSVCVLRARRLNIYSAFVCILLFWLSRAEVFHSFVRMR